MSVPIPEQGMGASAQGVDVPPEWQVRVESGRNLVTQLAMDFYGFHYFDTANWLNAMNDNLTSAYSPVFFHDFFPPSKMEVIQRLKLKGSFEFNQPIQLLAIDAQNETFLVGGGAKISSDRAGDHPVVQGDVALEVHVVQTPGMQGKVVLAKELTALPFDFAQGGPHDITQGRAPLGNPSPEALAKGESVQKTQKAASSEASPSKAHSAPATQKADPAAKFLGDTAGEAAKKFMGF